MSRTITHYALIQASHAAGYVGLTQNDFLHLLGEPVEAIRDYFLNPPEWLVQLQEALSRSAPFKPVPLPEELPNRQVAGFLDAIEPIISQARDRLHGRIQELIQGRSSLPFDPSTIGELLFSPLPTQLMTMLNRTMVLELNIARLEERLQGETPEERFRDFLNHVRERDAAFDILKSYPVLARQITLRLKRWVASSLEFLTRLCDDWDEISSVFRLENGSCTLDEIKANVGDLHRGGRTVLIAHFSSGFQIVYKPKSLGVDLHFQELLNWINDRGEHPPFRALKVIDRGSYGWAEFIAAANCDSPEAVSRFYERLGGYIALLYAIEATDFHLENLIASGEHPILIDLEALFHPRSEGVDVTQEGQAANNTLVYSVMRTGLLPTRLWIAENNEGVDLSGLGGVEGQLTPVAIPYLEEIGTDQMRVERKRARMMGGQNKPCLNGVEVDPLDYAEYLTKGFTNIYRLLLRHRDELLSPDGLLARFVEDEVRVILRATSIYALLLYESFHPDFLTNALERDRFFDKLWVSVVQRPYLAKIIPSERRDLLSGDIPMFTTRPGSRDIWSSDNQRIADFLDQAGMNDVRTRIEQLNERDLKQQLWFIRASLSTLSVSGTESGYSSYQLKRPLTIPQHDELRQPALASAMAIGDHLESIALRGKEEISWLGVTLTNNRFWTLAPLAWNLYDGIAWVSYFLSRLGAVTGQERYTSLAQAALSSARRIIRSSRSSIRSIGAFSGLGGWVYALSHLGVLWNQRAIIAEAEEMTESLLPLIDSDNESDIVGGAAGCIESLLSLYSCAPSPSILDAAIKCGERLLYSARQMESGIGWDPVVKSMKPLAGLSHGGAGMAFALLDLAAVSGDDRFRSAAFSAIEYERTLFSPEAGNWRDLRHEKKDEDQESFMVSWCHGAPGVGIGRLQSIKHSYDDSFRDEIDIAIKRTLLEGFGHNHSLCHGDLGNLDFLLLACRAFNNELLAREVDHFASMILSSIESEGWLCGVPLGVESPGLMNGLAGIGYGLLRFAESSRVPSVLALEPASQP